MRELTELFKNTGARFIKNSIESGSIILGVKVENFTGVLANSKEYAESLAKKLDEQAGVKGFISTDELPKYGISDDEKTAVKTALNVKENDVGIFVVDTKEKAGKAIELINEEVKNYKE
ncbi:MAG: hypothetical protein KJ655_03940 [Candidatus Thermoplasmatota archaeon]|nr:hypothetical protein [Candidatus Thermoplasmatota archaeon]